MAEDGSKNINDSELQKVTDFTDALNRIYSSADGSTKNGYVVTKELIDYILNQPNVGSEQKIYIPTTQPAIAAGNLTLDMLSNRQAMFEGRLAVGTLTINSDFNFIISNDTNALLLSCVLSLTGTRIITFEADVLVSNASSIGIWAAPNLTLTAGTDDLIEFQLLRYSTSSKWILKVGEVAV